MPPYKTNDGSARIGVRGILGEVTRGVKAVKESIRREEFSHSIAPRSRFPERESITRRAFDHPGISNGSIIGIIVGLILGFMIVGLGVGWVYCKCVVC